MRRVEQAAPATRPIAAGAVEVWWSPIDLSPEALAAARAALDRPTRDRIATLLRADDRRRSTVAHALLRRRAGEILGVAPERVVVRRRCVSCGATDHGRPELAPVAGDVPPAVSLSHAGGLAVVALRAGGTVGVDVEPHREVPDWERLRGHVFSEDEWAATERAAAPQVARMVAWTRKEAAAKATGRGVSVGLERVRIDPRDTDGWHAVTLPDGLGPMAVRDVDVGGSYAVAVAVDGPSAPAVVVRQAKF